MDEGLQIFNSCLYSVIQIGEQTGYARIDTGARRSSLLWSYDSSLPAPGISEIHDKAKKTPRLKIHRLSFLGERFDDVVADVSYSIEGQNREREPFPVLITLGCDVLLQRPLLLDMKDQRIRFLNDEEAGKRFEFQAEASFHFGPPVFLIDFGLRPMEALFDTGADLSALYLRLLTDLQFSVMLDEPVEMTDTCGSKISVPTFKSRRLNIQGHAFDGCRFLVLNMDTIERGTGLHVDFIYGLNAMHDRTWLIDRQRGVICIS